MMSLFACFYMIEENLLKDNKEIFFSYGRSYNFKEIVKIYHFIANYLNNLGN